MHRILTSIKHMSKILRVRFLVVSLKTLASRDAFSLLFDSLAASETTVTATMSFILAMLKYPEVQRKAQQEVDSVVGTDRLPEFSDQPHLPYLSAVLKEVLRYIVSLLLAGV